MKKIYRKTILFLIISALCYTLAMAKSPARLSLDYVKTQFEEAGCELLEDEYTNAHNKMAYICECGNIAEISYNSFQQGQRCAECGLLKRSAKRRLSHNVVKNVFEDNGCILLEDEYINNTAKMAYICECGNIAEIAYTKFVTGRRCYDCGIHKSAEPKRLSYENVKREFEKYGCELLEKEYTNSHKSLKYICSCGNMSKISYTSFRSGSRCEECGIKKRSDSLRHDINYVKDYFEKANCVLLEDEYIDNTTKMAYICECGNIAEIKFAGFSSGQRCKSCGDIKKIRKGSNSPNWNPLLTKEDRTKIRPGIATWKRRVHKRDKHKCVICESTKSLHAHHLYSYNSYKKLRNEVSNGITLCEKCHNLFHKEYGKGCNTKEQFDDYLRKIYVKYNNYE